MTKLPTPSSSWNIGLEGRVTRAGESRRRGRALTGKQRAASTCSACGESGHNSRNRKYHP